MEIQTAAGFAAVWTSLKFPILSTPIQGRPRRQTVAHVERRSQRKPPAEGRKRIRTSDRSLGLLTLEPNLNPGNIAPLRETAKPAFEGGRLSWCEQNPLPDHVFVRGDMSYRAE